MRIARLCRAKECHAPNFTEKTFAKTTKPQDSRKFFSFESFPLYGIRCLSNCHEGLNYQLPTTASLQTLITLFFRNIAAWISYIYNLSDSLGTRLVSSSQSVYLVSQVVPEDQCLPFLLVSLGLHHDHLVLASHLYHPYLEVPEQCIYWV